MRGRGRGGEGGEEEKGERRGRGTVRGGSSLQNLHAMVAACSHDAVAGAYRSVALCQCATDLSLSLSHTPQKI
jgi:hypothetical protein